MAGRCVILGVVVALLLQVGEGKQLARLGGVTSQHATFYGGADAAGTMGGACGYGNLYSTGYGTQTAAASIGMWNGGAICGACFEVQCINSPRYCIPDATTVVTVTNQCPQGSTGGWCDYPNLHLDMAYPAWKQIANDPMAGVVETQMWRVPCPRNGGVQVVMSGNPFFAMVLVYNVGGSGDITSVQVSTDGGNQWNDLTRNWGSMWSISKQLLGSSLSFKMSTGLTPETITVINGVPSNWYLGGTYQLNTNFAG